MKLSRTRIVLAFLVVVVPMGILTSTLTLLEASEEVVRFALAIGLIVTGLGSAQIAIRIPSTAELAEMDASEESTHRDESAEDRHRLSSPVR